MNMICFKFHELIIRFVNIILIPQLVFQLLPLSWTSANLEVPSQIKIFLWPLKKVGNLSGGATMGCFTKQISPD
jgi:hypothetical protein